MPGNSKRQGAVRKRRGGNPTAGSGARRRKGLEGKGPTPKARNRPAHKNYAPDQSKGGRRSRGPRAGGAEWVVGRNAVVEALQHGLPVTTVYVGEQPSRDDRIGKAVRIAADQNLSLVEVSRAELDRLTDGAVHQGLAAKLPPYEYADPAELPTRAEDSGEVPLLVALDSVTDPRNLGAVVRSAAAFGVHGVVVPERRSAGMTAGAWKASAGAAAQVPVARATNLTRQLEEYKRAGLMVVGLAAGAGVAVDAPEWDLAAEPLVVVLGSEGNGLSRLVREACDMCVRIPMAGTSESLNAGVAAGIALYEISRRRTHSGRGKEAPAREEPRS